MDDRLGVATLEFKAAGPTYLETLRRRRTYLSIAGSIKEHHELDEIVERVGYGGRYDRTSPNSHRTEDQRQDRDGHECRGGLIDSM